MKKLPKLISFTKEELEHQLKNGVIDVNFMIDYIVKIDEVYNLLIDKVNKLEDKNKSLLSNNKDQYETNKILVGRLINAKEFIEYVSLGFTKDFHLIDQDDILKQIYEMLEGE